LSDRGGASAEEGGGGLLVQAEGTRERGEGGEKMPIEKSAGIDRDGGSSVIKPGGIKSQKRKGLARERGKKIHLRVTGTGCVFKKLRQDEKERSEQKGWRYDLLNVTRKGDQVREKKEAYSLNNISTGTKKGLGKHRSLQKAGTKTDIIAAHNDERTAPRGGKTRHREREGPLGSKRKGKWKQYKIKGGEREGFRKATKVKVPKEKVRG